MIHDSFEGQFDNNVTAIKKAYCEVHTLGKKINDAISDYIETSKEPDSYKYLIIGRALNLAVYAYITVKFNHSLEFTKARVKEEKSE